MKYYHKLTEENDYSWKCTYKHKPDGNPSIGSEICQRYCENFISCGYNSDQTQYYIECKYYNSINRKNKLIQLNEKK